MKLVGLTKLHLNETYIAVCIGKNLFDAFAIQNGLKCSITVAFQL